MSPLETNERLRNLTKRLGDLPTALLTWLLSDTASLYNVLGSQPGVGNYLNLGWWDDLKTDTDDINEDTITEACRELVRHFAEFGGINADDRILDVGFGFGQQDILLAKEYDCRTITGINITPKHVRVGRQLVEQNNFTDRISLNLGDATRLPFRADSFDTVFALETAFHFHTREDFFREARRVLKPGGKILLADIIDGPERSSSTAFRSFLARGHEAYWNIPPANRVNSEEYRRCLHQNNFHDIVVEDVSDKVLDPWVRNYLPWRINQQPAPLRWLGQPMLRSLLKLYQSEIFSYVFVRARIPESTMG
ncbi:MAG: cyclopropane-fatty-acyl-phospholipid synthase family protein [bacterium]